MTELATDLEKERAAFDEFHLSRLKKGVRDAGFSFPWCDWSIRIRGYFSLKIWTLIDGRVCLFQEKADEFVFVRLPKRDWSYHLGRYFGEAFVRDLQHTNQRVSP